MKSYFKLFYWLMLGILFSVNIGLASCDDRYSEESKEELTPQALYQTSWRGTGSCAAWAVQNMGRRYTIYRYSNRKSKLGRL